MPPIIIHPPLGLEDSLHDHVSPASDIGHGYLSLKQVYIPRTVLI